MGGAEVSPSVANVANAPLRHCSTSGLKLNATVGWTYIPIMPSPGICERVSVKKVDPYRADGNRTHTVGRQEDQFPDNAQSI
jgi:hypothetical protein